MRIDQFSVLEYAVVKVRAACPSRLAGVADDLTLRDLLAFVHPDAAQVAVQSDNPV